MSTCKKTDQPLNVLFIDNFDSFVFNLVDEFEKRRCNVSVWRNDISVEKALALYEALPKPSLIVLSPGPGAPQDAGCCVDLIRRAGQKVPIFGVCLGHQSMVHALDGKVVRAKTVVHGKSSILTIDQPGVLFAGLGSTVSVGRYHSLIGEIDQTQFQVLAQLDNMVMAIQHRQRPLIGVQFHPESILTPQGGQMIDNIIKWAKKIAGQPGDNQ